MARPPMTLRWLRGVRSRVRPQVSGLDDADLASATSLSIKNVLDTCKEHFCDETTAASLIQLYGKAEVMEPQPAIELTQGITCARPLWWNYVIRPARCLV
jgi:hypothetical protein